MENIHSTKKSQLAAMKYLADKKPRQFKIVTEPTHVGLIENNYKVIHIVFWSNLTDLLHPKGV